MSDIKIPKNIVDKIFKRLDRSISKRKHQLYTNNTVILYNKPDNHQAYIIDVFSANKCRMYRSNPRVLPGNFTNVMLEADDVKCFTATFFENHILEYKIVKYESYAKYVKLDLFKLMRIEDCWYKDDCIISAITDGKYKEYIDDSLNSLFTVGKASKDLTIKVVPDVNVSTFILELLNYESGINFINTINKYFNINFNRSFYID